MAMYLLTVTPVKIETAELRYQIEADSPEEAERMFRNPEPGQTIKLVHEQRISTGAPRQEIPVVIVPLQTASSCTDEGLDRMERPSSTRQSALSAPLEG
jgi:hypothetical protein